MVFNDSFISFFSSFRKRNLFLFLGLVLCVLTFILSVTGTFLVRSGVLNSVHTFASDPSRGIYILIFLSLMIFISLMLLIKKFQSSTYSINQNSKETFYFNKQLVYDFLSYYSINWNNISNFHRS